MDLIFPDQCFFPFESLTFSNRTVMNKIILTCPDSFPSLEFSIRATHPFDVEADPRKGTVFPGQPLGLFVRWKGELPTDTIQFTGLKPPTQPRLRVDFLPANVFAPILLNIVFSFPSATQNFCYTLDGVDWFSSQAGACLPSMPSSTTGSSDVFSDILSPRRLTDEDRMAEAMKARETQREAWLAHQRSSEKVIDIEVDYDVRRRENARHIQNDLTNLRLVVQKKRHELKEGSGCLSTCDVS